MTVSTADELAQARLASLLQVADHARLLLDRLKAMGESGMLSEVAQVAVADWAARLANSLQAVPPPPAATEE